MRAQSMIATFALAAGCIPPDRATLAASSVAIACDFAQTAHSAFDGWNHSVEYNPLLRGRSGVFVVSYGIVSLGANALIWYFMPREWRAAYGATVTGWETAVLWENTGPTRGRWCW